MNEEQLNKLLNGGLHVILNGLDVILNRLDSVYSPFYKPTIIHFSNNKVNNDTNKLTSWIKSKGE